MDVPPLVEPVVVPCPYIDGMEATLDGAVAQFCGWLTVQLAQGAHRRVEVRFAMPLSAVDECSRKVRAKIEASMHRQALEHTDRTTRLQ